MSFKETHPHTQQSPSVPVVTKILFRDHWHRTTYISYVLGLYAGCLGVVVILLFLVIKSLGKWIYFFEILGYWFVFISCYFYLLYNWHYKAWWI